MLIDGQQMVATAERPLLRGPARTFVFEPSPAQCLVVDIPVATMNAAVSAAGARLPGHASIDASHAEAVIQLATQLAAAANRNRSLAALQPFSARDRAAQLPEPVRRLEDRLLDALVRVGGGVSGERRSRPDRCDVEALKAWLTARAHGPLRMTELAKHAGVSQRTVERSFLRTGCTPLEYLRGVRLEHARQLFAEATAATTVAEVARAAGFAHLSRLQPCQEIAPVRLVRLRLTKRTGAARRRGRGLKRGHVKPASVTASVKSWVAHARHAHSEPLRSALLGRPRRSGITGSEQAGRGGGRSGA